LWWIAIAYPDLGSLPLPGDATVMATSIRVAFIALVTCLLKLYEVSTRLPVHGAVVSDSHIGGGDCADFDTTEAAVALTAVSPMHAGGRSGAQARLALRGRLS
jgi:hypothetical protein